MLGAFGESDSVRGKLPLIRYALCCACVCHLYCVVLLCRSSEASPQLFQQRREGPEEAGQGARAITITITIFTTITTITITITITVTVTVTTRGKEFVARTRCSENRVRHAMSPRQRASSLSKPFMAFSWTPLAMGSLPLS